MNDQPGSDFLQGGGLRGVSALSQIERRRLTNGALIGLRVQHDFL